MSTRLSNKQKEIVNYIANCCDDGCLGYGPHVEIMWYWKSPSELQRYMKNLESSGFITIDIDRFYRVTSAGRAVISRPAAQDGAQ